MRYILVLPRLMQRMVTDADGVCQQGTFKPSLEEEKKRMNSEKACLYSSTINESKACQSLLVATHKCIVQER